MYAVLEAKLLYAYTVTFAHCEKNILSGTKDARPGYTSVCHGAALQSDMPRALLSVEGVSVSPSMDSTQRERWPGPGIQKPSLINSDALFADDTQIYYAEQLDFEWLKVIKRTFRGKFSLTRTGCNRAVGKWIIAETKAISCLVNTVTVFALQLLFHKSVTGAR